MHIYWLTVVPVVGLSFCYYMLCRMYKDTK